MWVIDSSLILEYVVDLIFVHRLLMEHFAEMDV